MLLIALAGTCADKEEPLELSSDGPAQLTEESISDDQDGDGWPADQDCDDTNASVYPLATEICGDGIDQDCDGGDECAEELAVLDTDRVLFGAWDGGMAGSAVAVHDLDGDGLHEVIVAAPSAGHAVLVDGPHAGSMEGQRTFEATAWSVSAGSDLDGDGTPEVVVGAPYDDGGTIYLLERWTDDLLASDADGILYGDDGDAAGRTVVARPDAIWFTAPGACGLGAVYGARDVLNHDQPLEDAETRLCGRVGADLDVGDLDGDGLDDLLVALREDHTAMVVYGAWEEQALEGPRWTGGALDPSVAVLGDVDGDGLNDVAVGPWVLTWRATGALEDRAAATLVDRWGDPVQDPIEGGGDLNGDGYAELLVGDASGSGAVWVVEGPIEGSWAMTRSAWVLGGERTGEVHGATSDGVVWLASPWADDQRGVIGLTTLY